MNRAFGFLFLLCMGTIGVLQVNAVAGERWPVPDHYFGPDTVVFVDIDITDITVAKLKDSIHGLFSTSKLQRYRVSFDPNKALAAVTKPLDSYRGMIDFIRKVVVDPVAAVGDRIYVVPVAKLVSSVCEAS
ncbi:MAG: hypothetical protein GF328_00840 [Candidatus Latescibacteria bacterium]|nr:hypothetical protein [Candidatus Latescibacterota bacterium]